MAPTEYFNSIREVFPDWQAEIAQLREFGDFLVIEARLFGTGEASGLEVDQKSLAGIQSSERKGCLVEVLPYRGRGTRSRGAA